MFYDEEITKMFERIDALNRMFEELESVPLRLELALLGIGGRTDNG